MANEFQYVSGDFEGFYFTNQKSILSFSESNSVIKDHEVRLYRGELNSITKEDQYNPEKFRDRDSLLLHNVTNVQFHLTEGKEGGNNNQIYDFDQVLLRDVVVDHSWEHNGKTYGIIKAKLYGKVKKPSKTADPIPNSVPPPPHHSPGITPPPNTPIYDNPTPNPTGGGSVPNKGCLSSWLSNIWRLLLALLLLLLILWFLKGCWKTPPVLTCCQERDSLLVSNNRCQERLDSLTNKIMILEDSIKRSKIEIELDELFSSIYFYGNTVRIRKISEDKINKIVQALKANPNLYIEIWGYHNSPNPSLIAGGRIDEARAEAVRNLIISKGIDGNRILSRGKGQSTIAPTDFYHTTIDEDGTTFKWNRNMRVEVNIIKI